MEPALNNAALMNKHLEKVPSSFECQITLETMKEPLMHILCGSTSEAKIVRDWVAKDQTCQNCRAHATMADFGPNLHLKNAIQELPEKLLRPLENISVEKQLGDLRIEKLEHENDGLKHEVHEKDIKIVGLENDKAELAEENTGLKGRVTVLGNEKAELINELDVALEEKAFEVREKKEALDIVKLKDKTIEQKDHALIQEKKRALMAEMSISDTKKTQAEENVSKVQSKSWGNTILAGTINSVCLGVVLAGTGPVGVVGALGAATVNAVRGMRKHEDLLQEELIAKESKADRERSIERKRQELERL